MQAALVGVWCGCWCLVLVLGQGGSLPQLMGFTQAWPGRLDPAAGFCRAGLDLPAPPHLPPPPSRREAAAAIENEKTLKVAAEAEAKALSENLSNAQRLREREVTVERTRADRADEMLSLLRAELTEANNKVLEQGQLLQQAGRSTASMQESMKNWRSEAQAQSSKAQRDVEAASASRSAVEAQLQRITDQFNVRG